MNQKKTNKPKGLINSGYFLDNFSHNTYLPKPKFSNFVEHYWLVSWNLPIDCHHEQAVIPHPNVHVTFLKNNSHIQGICRQKYTHTLSGQGNIIGVKFKPAGFYPFANNVDISMSSMTNSAFNVGDIFPLSKDLHSIEDNVLDIEKDKDKIEFIDRLLFSNLPLEDDNIMLINSIVSAISTNKDILKVSDICGHFHIAPRQLQRLFTKYVGVSAKWIVNRYRIHDVIANIEDNKNLDWSALALSLGYFDQAHFIRDFKRLLGVTPKVFQSSIK